MCLGLSFFIHRNSQKKKIIKDITENFCSTRCVFRFWKIHTGCHLTFLFKSHPDVMSEYCSKYVVILNFICSLLSFQDISLDSNAEKLALKYHPQVVLSSRSLFTLLNNHGLNYKEQWEIPVSVKMIPVEGMVYFHTNLMMSKVT